MPVDAKTVLQTLVTKTAAFNSTALDFKTGTPRRGYRARIIYKNASVSASTGSVTFRITESSDNSTFTGIHQTTEATIALSTTATSGEIFIPFASRKRYGRLELSAISGTDATIDYQGDLSISEP